MRTLVTGGAGFIGSHLVPSLLGEGHEVVVLDSFEEQVHQGVDPQLPAEVELIRGDVGDPACARRALAGVEQVVAQRPLPARLVVASSMSIYGEGEYECPTDGRMALPPRAEEQLLARQWELTCPQCGAGLKPVGTRETKALIPTSIYAITKRDHEELCLVTGAAYGIPAVALRFFNVYGAGQALSNPYTGVAAIFASRLLNGRAPLIFEDGRQTRDFIHVTDVVRGITLALGSDDAAGHAINLGTGRPSTVLEIAQALGAGLGIDVEPILNGQYRAGDIRHCVADPGRARELLGFEAHTSLEDGMGSLLQWLVSQDAVDRVDDAARELASRGLAR